MKSSSAEHDEPDREIIRLLNELRRLEAEYPRELMAARRAAFLAQAEEQRTAESADELSPADQEVIRLVGYLKTAPVSYPPELMAARRAALLQQAGQAGHAQPPSLWDRLQDSLQRMFPPRRRLAGALVPMVVAGFLILAMLGTLLSGGMRQPSDLAASAGVAAFTRLLPAGLHQVALIICKPREQTPLCPPPGAAGSSPNLAEQGNGAARPAVSKDARSSPGGMQGAAYVNDGRGGPSWVSDSPESWIKIDLGEVRAINTVSLQKGMVDSAKGNNPGQFVIAVARWDVYADGNSANDHMEYAQVFHSEQAGFSGTVLPAETIRTQFPSIEARFVKITFEQAGTAIEEVGVFLEEPPVQAAPSTTTPLASVPGMTPTPTATATPTDTRLPLLAGTPTARATTTRTPTNTAAPLPTQTSSPTDTPTPLVIQSPTNSPTLRPANTATVAPTNTSAPVPTDPLPSNTPLPAPTVVRPTTVPPTAVPPTAVPPTAVPPTVQPSPVSSDPIVVTGNEQTAAFTCNGNEAFIRGHSNTVTLLGSCSSITVTGNGNRVFYESGSPVINNRGNDNIISQR